MVKEVMDQENLRDFRSSKEAVWLFLDRATLEFASGNYVEAVSFYQKALDAIQFYEQTSIAEMLLSFALEDSFSAYSGEDFEQILSRLYFALALLQSNDASNAMALLRQAEEVQQVKREQYRNSRFTNHFSLVDNAIAKYLFALLLEKRGEKSNARILYRQVEKLLHGAQKASQKQVKSDLAQLDSRSKTDATVVILLHNGVVPHKESEVSPTSVVSLFALEWLLSSYDWRPAFSTITGIALPVLVADQEHGMVSGQVSLGKQTHSFLSWYDIAAQAREQLKQKLPLIAAKSVARILLRRGVVALSGQNSETAAGLVDLAMLISNALTQADTRSWKTLPQQIDLVRFDLPPGHYPLSFSFSSPCFMDKPRYDLKLDSGACCIINVFAASPSLCSIHIPSPFLLDGEKRYAQ